MIKKKKKAMNEKGRRRESHMYPGELPPSKVEELVSYLLSPVPFPCIHLPLMWLSSSSEGLRVTCRKSHLQNSSQNSFFSLIFPLLTAVGIQYLAQATSHCYEFIVI